MRTSVITAVALAAASLTAQSRESAVLLPTPNQEWLVPIHSLADDPVGGAYGQWAAGPDYKVRFDDGFTFYPVLGESYPHNLPLRWRTESITVGTQVIAGPAAAATPHVSPWRYELRRPGVTEAYDVLAQGVEQTFVLHEPLPGGGDVVVHGCVTTELTAIAPTTARDGSIGFADAQGRELIRYGRAIAFDATGRRTDVASSLATDGIRLRLAASWLAGATYPVTIDPLTSRVLIGTSATEAISYTSIGRDGGHDQLAVGFSRASAASDWDLFVRLRNDDMSFVTQILTDVNATWSTRYSSIAFATGADRWVIGFHRDFFPGSAVRIYLHDGGDQTLNNGTLRPINPPVGFDDRYPSVGGTATAGDNRAYVAFQRDPDPSASSNVSRVMGVAIDASAMTVAAAVNLHTNAAITDYDAESPCITQDAGSSGSWMVVWQELNRANSNDDWDLIVQRVGRDGTPFADAVLGQGNTATRHKLHPIVAGSAGRFMVSYLLRDNVSEFSATTGDELAVQRFDWNDLAPVPTLQSPRTLASAAGNTLRASVFDRPIAYDTNTLSHWAVAWRDTDGDAFVARVGFAGNIVEQQTVFADGVDAAISLAVCYNRDDYEFPLAFTTDEANNPVTGTRLQYTNTAQNTIYGVGCLGTIDADNAGVRDNPYRGSEFFAIRLVSGAVNAPTVLFLAANPALIPIQGGCSLNLDPTLLITFAVGVSSGAGGSTTAFSLPDTLPPMDLYWQFIQLDIGGITGSRGLRTEIR